MSRTVRIAAVASAGVLLALGGTAHAGAVPSPKKLTVNDPAGDALGGQKPYDVTRVTISTTGKKTGSKYTPKSLVVTLTVATGFSKYPGATYEVDADLAGCGYTNFTYTPGSSLGDGGLFTECGSPADGTGSTSTLYSVAPTVNGTTVTWDFPFSALSPEFKPNAVFSGISAHSAQNDPVFGLIGPSVLGSEGNFDNVATDASYKLV